jgi:hypothetical protein
VFADGGNLECAFSLHLAAHIADIRMLQRDCATWVSAQEFQLPGAAQMAADFQKMRCRCDRTAADQAGLGGISVRQDHGMSRMACPQRCRQRTDHGP